MAGVLGCEVLALESYCWPTSGDGMRGAGGSNGGGNGHASPSIPDYNKLSALDWSLLLKVGQSLLDRVFQSIPCFALPLVLPLALPPRRHHCADHYLHSDSTLIQAGWLSLCGHCAVTVLSLCPPCTVSSWGTVCSLVQNLEEIRRQGFAQVPVFDFSRQARIGYRNLALAPDNAIVSGSECPLCEQYFFHVQK